MNAAIPAAILWDMDGTLIDSEPSWIKAEHELVATHGNGAWSDDLAHGLIGSDLLVTARSIQHHGEVAMTATEIVEYLLEKVIDDLRTEVPWRPGARELLYAAVAADVPCALVTMSWRPLADAMLHHLDGVFAAVITGDLMADGEGKPHPRPYLMGAEALGVDVRDCVAIEDSRPGVESALRARCRVLAVANQMGSIPDAAGLTQRSTLAGLTLADLAALPTAP